MRANFSQDFQNISHGTKRLYQAPVSRTWTVFTVRKNTGVKEFGTIDKDCGKMWNDKLVSVSEGQMEEQKWDRQWGIRAGVRVLGTAGEAMLSCAVLRRGLLVRIRSGKG